jgi:hypothetical protein
MRLVDSIATCTTAVVVDLAGELYRLPGAGSFASAVSECPLRYVLEPDILEAAVQIAERWPDLLDPRDHRLRIPAETMWLEWHCPPGLDGKPRQAGVLVEASIDGRSGMIRSFWTGEHGPEAAQIGLCFDFDALEMPSADRLRSYPVICADAGSAQLEPHLFASVDQGWHRYFAATALGPDRIGEAVQQCASGIINDVLILFAFTRLLHSQVPMRRQEISRGRLNAARLRTGKAPLLDHVELSLAIGEQPSLAERRGISERHRARLHLVRGHLVRRRNAIFWRTPHLRGGGRGHGDEQIPIRTVHARLR